MKLIANVVPIENASRSGNLARRSAPKTDERAIQRSDRALTAKVTP